MATAPDSLTLARHRDRRGRRAHPWVRRAGLAIVVAIPAVALANVFGQRAQISTSRAGAAALSVYAPTAARSGLVYTARFRIDARRELRKAELVLAPGWADQYTMNGISPQPVGEASADGKLAFTLGHIPKGRHYTLFVSLQINPTNVGHHAQSVWLYDGGRQLAVVHREITIWP
jgi:hypothetical protein